MSHPVPWKDYHDDCLHEDIKTINAYKCECRSCGEVFETDGDSNSD